MSKVLQNAPREHSTILSTFIKLPFAIKTFVLSIFEWPLKTGFTVDTCSTHLLNWFCFKAGNLVPVFGAPFTEPSFTTEFGLVFAVILCMLFT